MVENAVCRIFGKGSRRVIIPGFGAFVKKENGEFLFTDLLRTDDGMLVSSVVCIFGISEDKAREIVRHYGVGLKKELADKGSVAVNGIGVLSVKEGVYSLIPWIGEGDVLPEQVEDGANGGILSGPVYNPHDSPSSVCEEAVVGTEGCPVALAGGVADEDSMDDDERINDCSLVENNAVECCSPAETKPENMAANCTPEGSDISGETTGETLKPAFQRTLRADKSRLRSALYGEQCVDKSEDLENGDDVVWKGGKESQAAIANGSETPVNDRAIFGEDLGTLPEVGGEEYTPHINIRHPNKPGKRVDGVLITAVIAILITLGVLLYGYLTKLNIDKENGQGILIEMNAGESAGEALDGTPQ